MKKRITCVILVLILLFSLSPPVIAQETVPLICLPGFASIPLVVNDGAEDEYTVFPPSMETAKAALGLLGGVQGNSANSIIFGAINTLFNQLQCDAEGIPMDESVGVKTFSKSLLHHNDEAARYNYARAYGSLTGERVGWANVYIFSFDWRLDTMEAGRELATFIDMVKAETGSDKVNIVASSMGACVAYAYLAQNEQAADSLNTLVIASSAIMGTTLLGDLFTGKFKVTAPGLENLVSSMSDSNVFLNFLSGLFTDTLVFAAKLFKLENSAVMTQLKKDFYAYTAIPIFGNFVGLWNLVPTEVLNEALAFMFPSGVNPVFEEKVRAYASIRDDAEEILSSLMDAGVKLAIVSNYDSQMIPVVESDYVLSDSVIDTRYTSFGATTANRNTVLPDSVSGSYVSPDRMIDASTSLFPEITWFIKGLGHNAPYVVGEEPVNLIMWLLESKTQQNVLSNASFTQFLSYNKATGSISPVTESSSPSPFSSFSNLFSFIFSTLRNMVNRILKLY